LLPPSGVGARARRNILVPSLQMAEMLGRRELRPRRQIDGNPVFLAPSSPASADRRGWRPSRPALPSPVSSLPSHSSSCSPFLHISPAGFGLSCVKEKNLGFLFQEPVAPPSLSKNSRIFFFTGRTHESDSIGNLICPG
jgi:hypothetical protein